MIFFYHNLAENNNNKLEVNVAHNILTLLTFVEVMGKVDPLGEEDGPATSNQVLSPDHPEKNQTQNSNH